ncbi:carbohydrate ABC transporter permease [Virgibacillus halophilus]|uniref:Carbohydrate ABC transporter permease n=2 Tax=Tigheibacillus halophilus TaxID=361280 RepID=A0ABU5C343_9BACI|nr:carbohydrate ABC transporter permease [Virgibacillus halophilus]
MEPTIEAYKITFIEQLSHIKTSLIISFGTVIFSLIIALPTAYALAKFRFKFINLILLLILITQMVPNIMMTTPLYLMFSKIHLLNTHIGLILADSTYAVPFIVLILRTVFMNIPSELLEASYIDGAGELKTFIRVVLPVSYSGIITGALFAFLFSWGDFIYALTLTTDESIRPITLGIYNFIGQYTENWNQLMAASVIAIAPVTILLIMFQKYITAGLTEGSTKG